MLPKHVAFFVASALILAGCQSSQLASVSSDQQISTARSIVGTSLVGAQGATAADQDKIDDTAAGLCGAGVWTRSECIRHQTEVSP